MSSFNPFDLGNAYVAAGGDCRDQAFHDLSQASAPLHSAPLAGLPDYRAGLVQPALDRINTQQSPYNPPLMNPFGGAPPRGH